HLTLMKDWRGGMCSLALRVRGTPIFSEATVRGGRDGPRSTYDAPDRVDNASRGAMHGIAAAHRGRPDGAPPRNILLVEDDPDPRDALQDVLAECGHRVATAHDGIEALSAMTWFHPDVVLLDLLMPRMDGWQFRLEQRRDPALADIPVIAMSASL